MDELKISLDKLFFLQNTLNDFEFEFDDNDNNISAEDKNKNIYIRSSNLAKNSNLLSVRLLVFCQKLKIYKV